MAYIENPNNIGTNAEVSGNALVYGDARVYGNADIESNNDWFSFIYQGKTLTGYRSRNDLGYELNINGSTIDINLVSISCKLFIEEQIALFTPKKNPVMEISITNLEKILGYSIKIIKD